ncbi:uncharacterized protein APUU_11837S [Aspergillus puulaauensis]|uniref:Uncharacterized protein n=1 Tax=Aspergillus puulaauensis TaxID=1220207 RepID=A0A7R7XCW3_9EURO|nr:uncharacterized protein APUU_11837S [Aspergillus puulaauensis]BCS19009.1 hypothetical protein APUU_11837S [Aspergillus puulaauensis]
MAGPVTVNQQRSPSMSETVMVPCAQPSFDMNCDRIPPVRIKIHTRLPAWRHDIYLLRACDTEILPRFDALWNSVSQIKAPSYPAPSVIPIATIILSIQAISFLCDNTQSHY